MRKKIEDFIDHIETFDPYVGIDNGEAERVTEKIMQLIETAYRTGFNEAERRHNGGFESECDTIAREVTLQQFMKVFDPSNILKS